MKMDRQRENTLLLIINLMVYLENIPKMVKLPMKQYLKKEKQKKLLNKYLMPELLQTDDF